MISSYGKGYLGRFLKPFNTIRGKEEIPQIYTSLKDSETEMVLLYIAC